MFSGRGRAGAGSCTRGGVAGAASTTEAIPPDQPVALQCAGQGEPGGAAGGGGRDAGARWVGRYRLRFPQTINAEIAEDAKRQIYTLRHVQSDMFSEGCALSQLFFLWPQPAVGLLMLKELRRWRFHSLSFFLCEARRAIFEAGGEEDVRRVIRGP